MNELFAKLPDDDKRTYRKSILKRNAEITDKEEELVEKNIDLLWDIFVKTDTKSLAYFPVKTSNVKIVNEVFERLNTGGMALSLADLLFSKIKAENFEFEEGLQGCSRKIYNLTGNGYLFSAYKILQLLHLIVKKGVRIDPKKVNNTEITEFITTWNKLEQPLLSFFTDYLWGQFKINNSAIVPKNLALLPIMVYFYEVFNKGFVFKNFSSENLKKINQYFIKSQINDWNLQSYADNFTRIIKDKSQNTNDLFEFPLSEIENYIQERQLRNVEIFEQTFTGYVWFALKILTPGRTYQFEPDMQGRFNPEIDHIFPKKLKDRTPEYESQVDIVWNMQPTKGDINSYKSNHHPRDFFTNRATNTKGEAIIGSKYVSDYDFLFPVNQEKQNHFSDEIWDNPIDFIRRRRELMIEFLSTNYDIVLK